MNDTRIAKGFALTFRFVCTIGLVAPLFIGGTSGASAQAVRCSAFLHNNDGSWRSFDHGLVIGPNGPVRLDTGDRLSSKDRSPKGDIARVLDDLCRSF